MGDYLNDKEIGKHKNYVINIKLNILTLFKSIIIFLLTNKILSINI